jgi:hypothetical protein
MSAKETQRALRLVADIENYAISTRPLPGLIDSEHTHILSLQIVDSLRRVEFANHLSNARLSPLRCDPTSELFDPLRAAVLYNRRGQLDEAWWLVFLATHFGKHAIDGWRLLQDVYGKLRQGGRWDWQTISRDPQAFLLWLADNEDTLRGADGISRRFSNHRKYESIRANSQKGTATTLISYVNWIAPPRSHSGLVRAIQLQVGQNPHEVFDALYYSMNAVQRFGRLAKFDFLAMLGKLGIAPIEPGNCYLVGATGPVAGARLLLGGSRQANIKEAALNEILVDFGSKIGVAAQPMEDALCNWQKSPNIYKYFKG